jgi:hypothetical protein
MLTTNVSDYTFSSPYDHVCYLHRNGDLVMLVTKGKAPQYHAVIRASPTWAYLCHCTPSGQAKDSAPYWMRWEEISNDGGIRFETRKDGD